MLSLQKAAKLCHEETPQETRQVPTEDLPKKDQPQTQAHESPKTSHQLVPPTISTAKAFSDPDVSISCHIKETRKAPKYRIFLLSKNAKLFASYLSKRRSSATQSGKD